LPPGRLVALKCTVKAGKICFGKGNDERADHQGSKLEIQLDEEIAQGAYCNLAIVNHSDTEFTIDFVFVQPQAPRAKVRSRVITSPRHAKRLLLALQENLARYERAFGPVEPAAQRSEAVDDHYH
jgi:hypothetical protein